MCIISTGHAFAFQTPVLQNLDTLTARSWTLEDGLPVNTVGNITQDSLGYLWINTYDGLVRFDGLNFKIFDYSNVSEMPHNRTTNTYIQDNGDMWVSLEYGGVLLIQGDKFHHFNSNSQFTNSDVTQMYEAADGSMFFIAHNGLFIYSNGHFSRFFDSEINGQNEIHQIHEAEDGTIWAASNNGLLKIDRGGKLIQDYNISDRQRENRFFSIFENNEGTVTVGTINGVYELHGEKLRLTDELKATEGVPVVNIYSDEKDTLFFGASVVYRSKNGLLQRVPDDNLKFEEIYKSYYRDTDNVLWLIGTSGTMSTYKKGKIEPFRVIDELTDYYFNNVFQDREKNLWFGTNRHGLIKVSKSKVRTIGKEEGLSGSNILAIYEDSQNRFWISTRGNGLNVIEENNIQQYDVRDGITTNIVQAIGEDKEGNIWLGHHQNGIDKVTEAGFEHVEFNRNIELNDVHAIFTDKQGTMWLGTYGGLVKFDPSKQQQKVFTKKDGLSGSKIRYITEDEDGGIWVGSLDGGVSRFYDNIFDNYTREDGLSSNNIRSIYIDEQDSGTVWIGTENNGLNRLKDGKITYVNTEDGLPDHIIHWISQDDDGWLWMSSNRGVIKIDKAELNQYLDQNTSGFTLLHYGEPEGMRNPEGNGAFQEAGIRISDGSFWFATQEGVAIFDSNITTINNVPPTVIVEQVVAGGKQYNPGHVNIERGYKSFQVNFHALTFNAPGKTRFRYRLNGYSEDWKQVFGKRKASFVNIPAGEYVFEVIAANDDGVWSEVPAKTAIIVQPFFYEQPWFYAIIILVLIGGYYGFSQIRYRYLLNQQEKLEAIITEQTSQIRKEKNEIEEKSEIIKKQAAQLKDSNETKDKFFSLIAHDLRNPFQALLGYSELMLDDIDKVEHPELWGNLKQMNSSSQSLLKLVENLLDWASLHTGKIIPEPEKVSLKVLIERIHEIFKHVANHKEISLIYKVEKDYSLNADLNMLETVLRNLVSNALKFTPQGGEVVIELGREEDQYLIKIQDTGIGMNPKLINDLLRLDANTSRAGTDNEKGSGLGLLICKEMVEMHGGEIDIESNEGEGTTFIIKLPVEGLSAVNATKEN